MALNCRKYGIYEPQVWHLRAVSVAVIIVLIDFDCLDAYS